jgi:hypothetical protein
VVVVNGTSTPQVSVNVASTIASGVVQLYNANDSTSTSLALTANAGYLLQQQINNLAFTSNLTLAGTINASTGNVATVTSQGTAAGFVVGSPLPAADPSNSEYYVIVSTAGTMTPPGGSAQACDQGDWWLSDGTTWTFLNVGPTIPVGSTTQAGIVQLYDGVNSTSITCAATPNSVKTAYDLAALAMPLTGGAFSGPVTFVGTDTFNGPTINNGTALFNNTTTFCGNANFCCPATFNNSAAFCCPTTFNATSTFCCPVTFCCTPVLPAGIPLGCAACITYNNLSSGLTATNAQDAIDQTKAIASAAIPCAAITAKGALITGTSASAPVALPVGTDGQGLVACSACASGLAWAAGSGGTVTNVSGTLPISVATGSSTPVISVATATTVVPGVTQLANNTTTNDPTLALTAAQGYALQQQVNSLLAGGGLTLAATMNAATGLVLTTTASGAGAGFTVGAALPAPAVGNTDYFVIVTAGGSYSPPGGGGPYTASQGDWFLSNGTTWEFLNVGPEVAYATTTTPGSVCLATNAQVAAGAATNLAVTPSGLASAYIANAAVNAKGAIITGTAASTPVALSVGANNQVLTACSACPSGLTWANTSGTPQATPAVLGTVFGCTFSGGFTALGLSAANSSTGGNSTAIGYCALYTATNATQATAIGSCALYSLTTGANNTAVGHGALQLNVTAQGNTAVGWKALTAALGRYNTAIGFSAGCTVTTGICNVLIGPYTNPTNPTDNNTLHIGWSPTCRWLTGDGTGAIKPGGGIIDCANVCGTAGQSLLSTGANGVCWGTPPGVAEATPVALGTLYGRSGSANTNVGLGQFALCATPTGTQNVAVGVCAMKNSGSGSNNVAVGSNSLCVVGTGALNTVVGSNSGVGLTTGSNNTFSGFCAGKSVTTANGNVALGSASLFSSTLGAYNTSVGTSSGSQVTFGGYNLMLGVSAGGNITTGCFNVAIGTSTTVASGTANCQLAIGYAAGANWLTGDSTLAIRPGAGIVDCAGTTGSAGQVLSSNGANKLCWAAGPALATPLVAGLVYGCYRLNGITAIGQCAALSGLGLGSTAIGCRALQNNVSGGFNNTAVGNCSLIANTTGSSNTAIGANALTANLTGAGNTAVGQGAGASITGAGNSAFGLSALGGNLGSYNTAMGNGALSSPQSGTLNVAVGHSAGFSVTAGSCNVIIGSCVNPLSTTGSCQLAIGFANNQNWLTGDSSKNIKPGAGILDCTNSAGTAGQVLTSTGTALQWASATPAKQYMSAYGCLTCTIGGVTAAKVNNWGVSSSSGIAIANNGDFTLTNGKKYLITVTLQPQVVTAGGQVTWGVYCTTPAFTQISPTQGHSIPTSNTSNNASESVLTFVYVPTATMQMSVCLSPAPSATYFTGYNNLTIVEI